MIIYAKHDISLNHRHGGAVWEMVPGVGLKPVEIKVPAGSPLVVQRRFVNTGTWVVLWFSERTDEWIEIFTYDNEITLEKP